MEIDFIDNIISKTKNELLEKNKTRLNFGVYYTPEY